VPSSRRRKSSRRRSLSIARWCAITNHSTRLAVGNCVQSIEIHCPRSAEFQCPRSNEISHRVRRTAVPASKNRSTFKRYSALVVPRGRLQRRDTSQRSKGRFRAHSSRMRVGHENPRSRDRSQPEDLLQFGCELFIQLRHGFAVFFEQQIRCEDARGQELCFFSGEPLINRIGTMIPPSTDLFDLSCRETLASINPQIEKSVATRTGNSC